jgi:hypothetical protein
MAALRWMEFPGTDMQQFAAFAQVLRGTESPELLEISRWKQLTKRHRGVMKGARFNDSTHGQPGLPRELGFGVAVARDV